MTKEMKYKMKIIIAAVNTSGRITDEKEME